MKSKHWLLKKNYEAQLQSANRVIVDFSVPYSSGHINAVKYVENVGQAANTNKPVCLLRNQLHICRKYNFLIRITTQLMHLHDVNNGNEWCKQAMTHAAAPADWRCAVASFLSWKKTGYVNGKRGTWKLNCIQSYQSFSARSVSTLYCPIIWAWV